MTAPKRGGRRRLDPDDDSVPVHVTMTATQFGETSARAQREHVTVAEVIRRAVAEQNGAVRAREP